MCFLRLKIYRVPQGKHLCFFLTPKPTHKICFETEARSQSPMLSGGFCMEQVPPQSHSCASPLPSHYEVCFLTLL